MVKARSARRKRASEDELYRSCKAGGICFPDVQNKYENKTLADKILQWVSSFLFFGNLGIGTGRGGGGFGGYTRLPGGSGRGSSSITPARPNVPVDGLVPAGVPIDAVTPESSSIPLLETEGGGIGSNEVEVIAEVHPQPNIPNETDPIIITDAPSITDAATIDTTPIETPEPPTRNRSRVTTSRHSNPSFDAIVARSSIPGESTNTEDVYIVPGLVGDIIGGGAEPFEEIPLVDLQPRTSTPSSEVRGVANKFLRRATNRRYTQQVQLQDRKFLTRPEQLIKWTFENPVYSPEALDEVSRVFEQDVEQLDLAPDPQFQDIVRLGAPFFTEVGGYVRASRIGQRGTIRLRSGTQIGGAVHYYNDLSPIIHEAVEMKTFGRVTGDSAIMQPNMEATFISNSDPEAISITDMPPSTFEDAYLLDPQDESFETTRLQFVTNGEEEQPTVISFPGSLPPGSVKVFIEDIGSIISYPEPNPREPDIITPDVEPAIIINAVNDEGLGYYLHPSLFKRKLKRLHFFADVSVAAQ